MSYTLAVAFMRLFFLLFPANLQSTLQIEQ
jgi:hypothetical protein